MKAIKQAIKMAPKQVFERALKKLQLELFTFTK